MKKFLLQVLPVVILIFAAVMTAQQHAIGPTTRISTNGQTQSCIDVWSATNPNSAASARAYHTAVWTGIEMIVWGGYADQPGISKRWRAI